jgi:hypothetical protein
MIELPSVRRAARRRGNALMVAVVALAVVAAVTAAVTWQCLAGRRVVDRRQYQLQSEWLARAGVELAADRLLADPAGYRGETVELIPESRVRIEVRAEPGMANVFRVTSEAHFPGDGRESVLRSTTRLFRRTSRDRQVRLEVVADSP